MGLIALTAVLGLIGWCTALNVPGKKPFWDAENAPRPKSVVDHPDEDPLHPDDIQPYHHHETHYPHNYHPLPHPWIDPYDKHYPDHHYPHKPDYRKDYYHGYDPDHHYPYKPDYHPDYYHGYDPDHHYPYKPDYHLNYYHGYDPDHHYPYKPDYHPDYYHSYDPDHHYPYKPDYHKDYYHGYDPDHHYPYKPDYYPDYYHGYDPDHHDAYKPDPYDHRPDYHHGYLPDHHYSYKPHPYENYPAHAPYSWPHYPKPEYPHGRAEKPQLPYPSHKVFHPYEDTTPGCEWRVVFKAVAGNGHSVFEDYMHLGNINTHIPFASSVASPLVYRDGEVLDRWDHIIVPKVKVELFVHGVRGVWFIFDGLRSTFTDWFDRDRLLASPYHDIKTGDFQYYSMRGDDNEENRFFIARYVVEECDEDCGFLAVVDSTEDLPCQWQKVGHRPLFIYSTLADTCGRFDSYDEVQYADRFVISVNLCDEHKLTE